MCGTEEEGRRKTGEAVIRAEVWGRRVEDMVLERKGHLKVESRWLHLILQRAKVFLSYHELFRYD